MATRCFWDADADNCTHDVFMNVSLFGTLFFLSQGHVGIPNQITYYLLRCEDTLFIFFGRATPHVGS